MEEKRRKKKDASGQYGCAFCANFKIIFKGQFTMHQISKKTVALWVFLATESRPHAPLEPMRSAPAYFLSKWGV